MIVYKLVLWMASIMLFLSTLAALSLPSTFYGMLRIVVCGIAICAAIRARNSVVQLVGLVLIAVVFNPLAPIDFPQTTWRIIELASAATFIRLAMKPFDTQNR